MQKLRNSKFSNITARYYFASLFLLTLLSLNPFSPPDEAIAQGWDKPIPAFLDQIAGKYSKPNIVAAFGTFTFSDSQVASPFSR